MFVTVSLVLFSGRETLRVKMHCEYELDSTGETSHNIYN